MSSLAAQLVATAPTRLSPGAREVHCGGTLRPSGPGSVWLTPLCSNCCLSYLRWFCLANGNSAPTHTEAPSPRSFGRGLLEPAPSGGGCHKRPPSRTSFRVGSTILAEDLWEYSPGKRGILSPIGFGIQIDALRKAYWSAGSMQLLRAHTLRVLCYDVQLFVLHPVRYPQLWFRAWPAITFAMQWRCRPIR